MINRVIISIWLIIISGSTYAQIKIDGLFSEWQSYQEYKIDDKKINSLKITDDANYLYILLDMKAPIKLNNEENFVLAINTDGNKNSGRSEYGYDIAYDFSHKKGVNFSVNSGEMFSVYTFDMHYLPTIRSSKYELAINKDSIKINAVKSIEIAFFNEIKSIEKTQPIVYVLKNVSTKTKLVRIDKKPWFSLRFMTYNVLHDGIIKNEQQSKIMAIIKAANPEIITLNECWNATPDTLTNLFVRYFPNSTWYAVKSDEGNITMSRYPILKSVNINKNARITANYIEYKKDTLLVINVHFKCCNDDKKRTSEVISIIDYIETLKKRNESYPLVIMGDYNFVGEANQLDILLNGTNNKPDWDNTRLTNLLAYQANTNFSYTWYDEESDYMPGKLDYIIYSDSRLKSKRSFVINSRFLNEKQLKKYKFARDLSQHASDHLPVVVDFKLIKK